MTNLNIEPNGFYFQSPEYDQGLSKAANVAIKMGAMASRLVLEERTRTHHPDGRRENVAEHSNMLAKVATEIAAEMYPGLDRGSIALYASVHDDVEAYVRDTPTDRIDGQGLVDKAEREALGLEQLLREHSSMPAYCQTVREYEAQRISEARFVRVVDKLTTLLIHIPNQGKIIQENYTREEFLRLTKEAEERWMREYPEYDLLIEMRTELAHHLCDLYLPD